MPADEAANPRRRTNRQNLSLRWSTKPPAMSTSFEILAAYYTTHNPPLVDKVHDVLQQFPGAEGWLALSTKLEAKYQVALPIPAAFAKEVEQLMRKAQSGSAESDAAAADAREKARARARARALRGVPQGRRSSSSSEASVASSVGSASAEPQSRRQRRRGSNSSAGSARSARSARSGRRGSGSGATPAGAAPLPEGVPPPARGSAADGLSPVPEALPRSASGRTPRIGPRAVPSTPTAAEISDSDEEFLRLERQAQAAASPAKMASAKPVKPRQQARSARVKVKAAARPSATPGSPEQPATRAASPPQVDGDYKRGGVSWGRGRGASKFGTASTGRASAEVKELLSHWPVLRESVLHPDHEVFSTHLAPVVDSTSLDGLFGELDSLVENGLAGAAGAPDDETVGRLHSRTDSLAGNDARALLREMVAQLPAAAEWLEAYEFPSGTTFRPAQAQRGGDARVKRGQAAAAAAERRSASDRRLAELRTKLRSLSYGMGGQDPRRLFEHYDRNNSGTLELTEFSAAVRKGGGLTTQVMSDKELEAVFRSADADADGHVDINELTAFVWADAAEEGTPRFTPSHPRSALASAHAWPLDARDAWS